MGKGITAEALSAWKSLVAMKQEAVDKIMKRIPGAKITEAKVEKIGISPSNSEENLEECEIFLDLDLSFLLENVTIDQIVELIHSGQVSLINSPTKSEKWYIEYTTTYCFEFDKETGAVLKGTFSG